LSLKAARALSSNSAFPSRRSKVCTSNFWVVASVRFCCFSINEEY
jgi:hypothetical protein